MTQDVFFGSLELAYRIRVTDAGDILVYGAILVHSVVPLLYRVFGGVAVARGFFMGTIPLRILFDQIEYGWHGGSLIKLGAKAG